MDCLLSEQEAEGHFLFPRAVLSAIRRAGRGKFPSVRPAAGAQHGSHQQRAGACRHRRSQLASGSRLGETGPDRDVTVGRGRQRGAAAGGHEGHTARTAGSRVHRRRQPAQGVPVCDASHDHADHFLQSRHRTDRRVADVCAGVHCHVRRSGQCQPDDRALSVRERIQVLQDGLRFGHRVDSVPDDPAPDLAGVPFICPVGVLRGGQETWLESACWRKGSPMRCSVCRGAHVRAVPVHDFDRALQRRDNGEGGVHAVSEGVPVRKLRPRVHRLPHGHLSEKQHHHHGLYGVRIGVFGFVRRLRFCPHPGEGKRVFVHRPAQHDDDPRRSDDGAAVHHLPGTGLDQHVLAAHRSEFFAGAFNVFLIRQFVMGIPRSLDEAAMIDGMGHLGIYAKIISR